MSDSSTWPEFLLQYKHIVASYFPVLKGNPLGHIFIRPDKPRHLVTNEDMVRYKNEIEQIYKWDKMKEKEKQVDIHLDIACCVQVTTLPKFVGVQRIHMRRCYSITNIEILEEVETLGFVDYSKNLTERYGQKRYVSVNGKGFWCWDEEEYKDYKCPN